MTLNNSNKTILTKQAFIFDLFETLTAQHSTYSHFPSTADLLGVPPDKWRKQLETNKDRYVKKTKNHTESIQKMTHAINPNISLATIKIAADKRLDKMAYIIKNIPEENIQTLKTLKQLGKKLGLISNTETSEILAWNESPLKNLFDITIFSCEVGYAKPDPKIYDICLKNLNSQPEDCVFIDEGSSEDLETSKRLGMTTIFISGVIENIVDPEIIEYRKNMADFHVLEIKNILK